MKKWIACVLLVCLLAAALPMTVSAASGSCGENVTWNLSADGVLTISGTGEMAQYAQPEDVPWFSQRAFVYKAVVEEGITALAPYCFYQCTYMTDISLPESLTTVGAMALESCCMLTELRLGKNVTDIGMSAFYDCSELVSVYIPGKISTIGFGSFFNCRKLENVYIEDLASWCQTAFGGMNTNPLSIATNLYVGGELVTDLEIPEGVTYVAASAFFGWRGIQSVTVPDSVEEIRSRAFYDCQNLRSVNFGDGLEKLGEKSFRDCAALESITFTGDMPTIHKDAFQNVTAAACYPAGNSTWKDPGQYGGTLTWSKETAHTHSYTANITAPTCTSAGYTTYSCACGDSYVADEVAASGHAWGQWVETVKPDAKSDGVNTRMCTLCGETETEVVDNNIFTDVKKDRFEEAILWAYYGGITTGTGDGTTFSPENACTRKQIVTFLWRAAGEPEPKSMENPFTDVKHDRFEKAILWAYYEGITTGTGDGSTFSPENTCTRKQIVTFLWRYNGEPKPKSMENKFVDVKNDRFAPAILWAAEQGITTGTGDGSTFSPESPCTRKQIVTFLYRNLNK